MADTSSREIERIHDKLDRLAENVSRLAALEEKNALILPRLEAMLADHETRLGKVEQHNWERLDMRIDDLERWKSSMKGWIAGATAVVTIIGGTVLYFIQDMISHMPPYS